MVYIHSCANTHMQKNRDHLHEAMSSFLIPSSPFLEAKPPPPTPKALSVLLAPTSTPGWPIVACFLSIPPLSQASHPTTGEDYWFLLSLAPLNVKVSVLCCMLQNPAETINTSTVNTQITHLGCICNEHSPTSKWQQRSSQLQDHGFTITEGT